MRVVLFRDLTCSTVVWFLPRFRVDDPCSYLSDTLALHPLPTRLYACTDTGYKTHFSSLQQIRRNPRRILDVGRPQGWMHFEALIYANMRSTFSAPSGRIFGVWWSSDGADMSNPRSP